MREFIRHPTDIPIEYEVIGRPPPVCETSRNVNRGGLCFQARSLVEAGSRIRIHIPVLEPAFETLGIVVWCRERNPAHDVGVCFDDPRSEFVVRMVEQICHIEQYRRDLRETDGRILTAEEAAREWIDRFAEGCPR